MVASRRTSGATAKIGGSTAVSSRSWSPGRGAARRRRRRPGVSRPSRPAPPRPPEDPGRRLFTTSTGQSTWRATLVETLPSSTRLSGVRPRRRARQDRRATPRAARTISSRGSPSLTSSSTTVQRLTSRSRALPRSAGPARGARRRSSFVNGRPGRSTASAARGPWRTPAAEGQEPCAAAVVALSRPIPWPAHAH